MPVELFLSFTTANRETETADGRFIPTGRKALIVRRSERALFAIRTRLFSLQDRPDIQNLGKYLFRSSTYPVYVINSFNRPYARLLGLQATLTFFETFREDFLLASDYLNVPLQDWSFSYLASYTIAQCVDVGGG